MQHLKILNKFGNLQRTLRLILGTRWDTVGDLGTDIAAILALLANLDLTTYGQRTAAATNANGVNWVDLLDMSALANPEEIWGINLTIAGGWAGLCQMRIIEAVGSVKIFPFAAQAEQNTDFFSGVYWAFQDKVAVPVAYGYILQFRSTNGADGAGQTCALTELAVIARG